MEVSGQSAESVVRSHCRICHGGCGVLVHVKDGRVIRIEGDPESPISRGTLCPKGIASIQLVYHPDRLLYPLKRKGAKGEGKWERISWDEAYEILTSKMNDIKSNMGQSPSFSVMGQVGIMRPSSTDLPTF